MLRDTYKLETTEGGINEHMKRKQVIKGHSLPKEHEGRDESAHRKGVSY